MGIHYLLIYCNNIYLLVSKQQYTILLLLSILLQVTGIESIL